MPRVGLLAAVAAGLLAACDRAADSPAPAPAPTANVSKPPPPPVPEPVDFSGLDFTRLALGETAKVPVPNERGLFFEVVPERIVPAASEHGPESVRCTVRLCRADGTEAAGHTTGPDRVRTDASRWTGDVSDHASVGVRFEDVTDADGKARGFAFASIKVTAAILDPTRVALDFEPNCVVCVR
jgi:hypothetical protein